MTTKAPPPTPAAWRNRMVGSGQEAPDQLLANPGNWRLHPKNQQAALAGALDTVGRVQQVMINQRTGFVVDGHARVAATPVAARPEWHRINSGYDFHSHPPRVAWKSERAG